MCLKEKMLYQLKINMTVWTTQHLSNRKNKQTNANCFILEIGVFFIVSKTNKLVTGRSQKGNFENNLGGIFLFSSSQHFFFFFNFFFASYSLEYKRNI